MKKCELCGGIARMHCESDQASLCWDCDVKVHGANFLVAKHSRTLLCHVCQNPTSWFASGCNLSPAVSVCESCVRNNSDNNCEVTAQQEESSEGEFEEEEDNEDFDDDDEEDEEEEEEEEEEEQVEDAENQVVPWSGDSSSFLMSKPVASLKSLSSSEGDAGGTGGGRFGSKRMRENHSFYSDYEIGCSSSHVGSAGSPNGEASSMGSSRLLKQPRLAEVDHDETDSRSTAIINSLKRLQERMITNDGDSSATIIGIHRLSRNQSR